VVPDRAAGDDRADPYTRINGQMVWNTPTPGGADTMYIVFQNDTQRIINNGYFNFEDSLIYVVHEYLQADTGLFAFAEVTFIRVTDTIYAHILVTDSTFRRIILKQTRCTLQILPI